MSVRFAWVSSGPVVARCEMFGTGPERKGFYAVLAGSAQMVFVPSCKDVPGKLDTVCLNKGDVLAVECMGTSVFIGPTQQSTVVDVVSIRSPAGSFEEATRSESLEMKFSSDPELVARRRRFRWFYDGTRKGPVVNCLFAISDMIGRVFRKRPDVLSRTGVAVIPEAVQLITEVDDFNAVARVVDPCVTVVSRTCAAAKAAEVFHVNYGRLQKAFEVIPDSIDSGSRPARACAAAARAIHAACLATFAAFVANSLVNNPNPDSSDARTHRAAIKALRDFVRATEIVVQAANVVHRMVCFSTSNGGGNSSDIDPDSLFSLPLRQLEELSSVIRVAIGPHDGLVSDDDDVAVAANDVRSQLQLASALVCAAELTMADVSRSVATAPVPSDRVAVADKSKP